MTPARWHGWHRPGAGGPWRRLAEADSFDDAWGQLLARLPPGRGGDSVVLPLGRHPDEKPAASDRRRQRARR